MTAKKADAIVWILLVIYIVFYFISRQLFGIPVSTLNVLIIMMPILLMLAVVLANNGGRIDIRPSFYHFYVLLFGVFCLASALWAREPSFALSKGELIFEAFIIMTVVSVCFQKRGEDGVDSLLKAVTWAYYIVVIYELLYYGWNYFIQVMSNSERFTSEFVNSNILGMCASFAVIINIYLVVTQKTPVWTLVFAVLAILMVAASGSRKALISIFLGVLFFFFMKSLGSGKSGEVFIRLLLTILAFLIAVYIAVQLPMFSGVMKRIKDMTVVMQGNTADLSTMHRLEYIKIGVDLFKKNPLLGVGIDNPRLYAMDAVGRENYLHNNYVEIMAAGGIVGMVIYYSIYVKLLYSYWKRRDFSDPQYCICATLLLLCLILDYGRVAYYSWDTYIHLFIFFEYEKKLRNKHRGSEEIEKIIHAIA